MKAGFAFRFADGGDDHLWFVISDPARDPFLLVSVTTLRFAGDQSCLLDVGDHPFIQHPSRIA